MRAAVIRFDELLTRLEGLFLVATLAPMVLAIFWGVLERFIIKAGQGWTEEMARYLCIWATFVGSSLAVKTGSHIGVNAFMLMLPSRARAVCALVATVICLVFSIVVVKYGVDLTGRILAMKQLSPGMRIPLWPIYAAIPVGFFLTALRYFMILLDQCGLMGNITSSEEGGK